MEDLTGFQKNIVNVLVGDSMYGLEVKKELEGYYDQEINHGRLYPNLDRLQEENYVEKYARDERTNEYRLTQKGREKMCEELRWRLEKYVDESEDRKSEVKNMLENSAEAKG